MIRYDMIYYRAAFSRSACFLLPWRTSISAPFRAVLGRLVNAIICVISIKDIIAISIISVDVISNTSINIMIITGDMTDNNTNNDNNN